jgi:hypothetical protein
MQNLRNNHWVRIGVIVFLMLLLVILYFRNVNTSNINSVDSATGELKAQAMPDTWEKKVYLGLFGLLGAALGLEATQTDLDLGKLIETKGDIKASKVLRDKSGNVVNEADIATGKVKREDVKYTNEYNCDDFKSQPEAQAFFIKAGGPNEDVNRLDGNNDGVACQALPKK